MNRQIKFRALRPNGKWAYGNLVYLFTQNNRSGLGPVISFHNKKHDCIEEHTCKPGTEGQYTGLKDKNGVEIYEGDINMCRIHGTDAHIEELFAEVIYDLTVGAFGYKSGNKFFGLNSKILLSAEILGNIHQNPDLLK